MLEQRIPVGHDSRFRQIEDAGGLFIVGTTVDVDAARTEVLRAGIRALEVHVSTLEFLRDLPLEFLFLNAPLPRIEPVATLARLRSLAAGAWEGALDFGALRSNPSLVVLQTGRSVWLRPAGEWLHLPDIYALTPQQLALYDALHERRNAIKAW